MRLDVDADAGPGRLPQHIEDGVGGRSEDLDAGGRIEGLGVGTCRPVADDLHVIRHRLRVGMDPDDAHLATILLDVLVESQDARLGGGD